VKKVHRISRAISNFQKRVAFDVVKRAINNSHIESRRGSQQQAIEYCRKEGDFHEWGSPKNQGDRTDLQSIKRALESNSSIKTLLDSDLEINSHGLRLGSKQLRNFVFTWNNPYGEKIGTWKQRMIKWYICANCFQFNI